ncbi:MAG: LCP family protein [Chloroflexi bacterium]|nr:LCP family protein [Chloroflexota bacterium]
MTKPQKIILGVLTLAACMLVSLMLLVGILAYLSWVRKPLGPALSTVPPLTMPATWTPAAIPDFQPPSPTVTLLPGQPVPTEPVQMTALPTDTPVSSLARCGGPSVMHLLLIGSDQRGDSYAYGLGDVIRLVRIDFVVPKVTVLEFPRDLWVQIPDIADNLSGQDHERLNQAYLYGNPGFGYTDDPAQGPGLMARTLTLNFGAQVDHYAAVNMRTFEKIVNAVDGIDIYLPETLSFLTADTAKPQRMILPQGWNHLNGNEALWLARLREDGVFERANSQDQVLCALRKKLTEPEVLPRIPKLIQSFQDNVQTDLSLEQIGQLACLGPLINADNVVFVSFPQEEFKQSRIYDPVFKKEVFVWDVDFDILRQYVARFQAGEWPAPTFPGQPDIQDQMNCQ